MSHLSAAMMLCLGLITATPATAQTRCFHLRVHNASRQMITMSGAGADRYEGDTFQNEVLAAGGNKVIWMASHSADGGHHNGQLWLTLHDPRFQGEKLPIYFNRGGYIHHMGDKPVDVSKQPATVQFKHFEVTLGTRVARKYEQQSDHEFVLTIRARATLWVGRENNDGDKQIGKDYVRDIPLAKSGVTPSPTKYFGVFCNEPTHQVGNLQFHVEGVPATAKQVLVAFEPNGAQYDASNVKLVPRGKVVSFPAPSTPGVYLARLYVDPDSRNPMPDMTYPVYVWARPELKMKDSFNVADNIVVEFDKESGNIRDLIMLTQRGQVVQGMQQFAQKDANGKKIVTFLTAKKLPPGDYEAHYFNTFRREVARIVKFKVGATIWINTDATHAMGSSIDVRFGNLPKAAGRPHMITIAARGAKSETYLKKNYVDLDTPEESLELSTEGLEPGEYEARVHIASNKQAFAKKFDFVIAAPVVMSLKASKSGNSQNDFKPGQDMYLTARNLPAKAGDLFVIATVDSPNSETIGDPRYNGGRASADMRLQTPPVPGRYEVRFFANGDRTKKPQTCSFRVLGDATRSDLPASLAGEVNNEKSTVTLRYGNLSKDSIYEIHASLLGSKDGERVRRDFLFESSGEVKFQGLDAGKYEARLMKKGTTVMLKRFQFQVIAAPVLTTGNQSYRVGDKIVVNFKNLPGTAGDAILLMHVKSGTKKRADFALAVDHDAGTSRNGRISFGSNGLDPGTYEVHFIAAYNPSAGQQESIKGGEFQVRKAQ